MMLALIGRLSPVLAIVIGLMGGTGLTLGAAKLWNDWIDNPSIAREATARADDAAAIRVMDAANRAEQAERARQKAASAEALHIYREALNHSQQAAVEAATKLEQEIADHDTALALEGRSCRITGDDLLWLRGNGQPADAK